MVDQDMSRTMDYLLAANFIQAFACIIMGVIVWNVAGPFVALMGVSGLIYSLYNLFFVRGVL